MASEVRAWRPAGSMTTTTVSPASATTTRRRSSALTPCSRSSPTKTSSQPRRQSMWSRPERVAVTPDLARTALTAVPRRKDEAAFLLALTYAAAPPSLLRPQARSTKSSSPATDKKKSTPASTKVRTVTPGSGRVASSSSTAAERPTPRRHSLTRRLFQTPTKGRASASSPPPPMPPVPPPPPLLDVDEDYDDEEEARDSSAAPPPPMSDYDEEEEASTLSGHTLFDVCATSDEGDDGSVVSNPSPPPPPPPPLEDDGFAWTKMSPLRTLSPTEFVTPPWRPVARLTRPDPRKEEEEEEEEEAAAASTTRALFGDDDAAPAACSRSHSTTVSIPSLGGGDPLDHSVSFREMMVHLRAQNPVAATLDQGPATFTADVNATKDLIHLKWPLAERPRASLSPALGQQITQGP